MNQDVANHNSLMVFTDLDGTLLDHESYSFEPALESLNSLKAREIPLILCSSKTAKEIRIIHNALGLETPFICENGAALFGEDGELLFEAGIHRDHWLEQVQLMRQEKGFQFQGFSDWSEQEVSIKTGLNEAQSSDAKERQYSEPISWLGSSESLQQFKEQLAILKLQLVEGGRFLSIQSQYNKSDAMDWLIHKCSDSSQGSLLSIALGDSPNDEAMLNRSDIPVIIKSEKSERISITTNHQLTRTNHRGPEGWHEAMTEILARLDANML